MERKDFLKLFGLSTLAMAHSPAAINHLFDEKEASTLMPTLFVGHGSPMNGIEDNEFNRKWREVGKSLPVPKAILCVSAHWMTRGKTKILAMEHPETIHDFGGFPQALFDVQYAAPGSPEYARQTKELIQKTHVELDENSWGLDHGCWVPLMAMFPQANIPVYQLSIDMNRPPVYHYELAKDLKELRRKDVLIVGSGNIVHNLYKISMNRSEKFDWSIEFDTQIKQFIESGNHAAINDYEKIGQAGKLAVPTTDHYLPLMYILALQDKKDNLSFFNESIDHGSISMRSVMFS